MASKNSKANNRLPLKCRPREEREFQMFLQADLEVVEIDWNNCEGECPQKQQQGKYQKMENIPADDDTKNHVEECEKRVYDLASAPPHSSFAATAEDDEFNSSRLKRRKKCRKTNPTATTTKCLPTTADIMASSNPRSRRHQRNLLDKCVELDTAEKKHGATIEDIFDEIILNIFAYLPRPSIASCIQVNKRWKRIGNDQTLWKSVNLDSKHFTVEGHLGNILHRGVETLRLSKAEILAPICMEECTNSQDELQCCFSLKSLDCSMSKFQDGVLEALLFLLCDEPNCFTAEIITPQNCKQLQNLSLESCKLNHTSLSAVGLNTELQVLNLALCVGVHIGSMDMISRQCPKLTSLNLSWTNQTRDIIRTICRCRELRELNLSGLRGGIDRKYMELLVRNCKKLVSLDFSDVALQIGSLKLIADNLTSLTTLSISRCSDVRSEQLFDLFELKSLSHLNLFGFLNMTALDRFSDSRPDIHINKHVYSPIARPIASATYEGRLWEQYVGFII